jgi:hypothetical protein
VRPVDAATYYVRPDGGTAAQCNGTTDAAYPGSGTGRSCAFNHPNWALEYQGQPAGRLNGSDKLVIVRGLYRIGCLNPTNCRDANYNVTAGSTCDRAYPNSCIPNPIPNGTSGNPTLVIGCSLNGCPNPGQRPELWAAGRIAQVINLNGSSNVVVQDLVITDHADCGVGNTHGYDCGAADSSELSGRDGINVINASNIVLKNLQVHGFYRYGMFGGGGNNITLDNVNLDYNSFGGWDTDNCSGAGNCGLSGTIAFQNGTTIRYNGCVENNPGYGNILPGGCYSQDQSGYGDGLGTGNTAGNWVFNHANISHNVSDGVDLLYLNRGAYSGGSVNVKSSLMEGNAGNQLKGPNNMYVEDSFIIGNCGYFNGQPFTQGGNPAFNHCRAGGNAVAISFHSGDTAIPKIYNNTVLSNGDVMFEISGTCNTGTNVLVKNNILRGGKEWHDDPAFNSGGNGDNVSVFYDVNAGSCNTNFVEDYNICYGDFKEANPCPAAHDLRTNPLFTGTIKQGPNSNPGYYSKPDYVNQLILQPTSPAIGRGNSTLSGANNLDYDNYNRGNVWDVGALQHGSLPGGDGFRALAGTNTRGIVGVGEQINVNPGNIIYLGILSSTGQYDPVMTGVCSIGTVAENPTNIPNSEVTWYLSPNNQIILQGNLRGPVVQSFMTPHSSGRYQVQCTKWDVNHNLTPIGNGYLTINIL